MAALSPSLTPAAQTERRIAWLILLTGALAGATAAALHDMLWATGLMIGAILAWFNFRWLRQGMDALPSPPKPRPAFPGRACLWVPISAYSSATP